LARHNDNDAAAILDVAAALYSTAKPFEVCSCMLATRFGFVDR
jgi:hypothetical protein